MFFLTFFVLVVSSVAAFTQTYYDYLFKRCSGASNPKLLATNYPLPLTTQQSTEIRTILSIIAAMLLAIPFNYIPAAFTVFLVKERSCKSKHLQLVSGVDMSAYWISNYLWDICLYFILTILAMVGFLCFGDVAAVFIGSIPSFFCTLAMIFGYGLSSLPFAYIFSRFFDNAPNAQISIMILFFVTGFVASNAYFIMENIEATREIAKGLRPLFRTWPAYNLAEGFLNLAYNFWESQISADAPSPFSWDACGRQILLLYALAPPYFMWLTFLEYSSDGGSGGQLGRFARRIRALTHSVHNRIAGFKRITATEEDSDVVEEKESVKENKKDLILHSPVVIHDLWKTFPKGSLMSALFRKLCCCLKSNLAHSKPKVAVNNVSIHVDNGVTLGLLGVNGAGKIGFHIPKVFYINFSCGNITSSNPENTETKVRQLQWGF
jgi:ABC-type multidrug transport system fused ATPase/permease subunit